jgi:hypothetical protein
MVEPVGELEPAAGDVGNLRRPDLDREIGRHLLARLVEPPRAGKYLASEDQRLGLGPALGQAALEEQLIKAAPRQQDLRYALAARA